MGYFLIDAPESRFPHRPEFEGPVVGFKPKTATEAIAATKESLALLELRARWLNAFLSRLQAINPEIPRDVAVEWVNHYFPKTATLLELSIGLEEPSQLAERLADAWKAA